MSAGSDHIRAYFGLSEAEYELIKTHFKPKRIAKGDFLLKEGQFCKEMALVTSGMIREFFNTEGRQITMWISAPGYFAMDLESYMNQVPSSVNLQAITNVEILSIGISQYNQLHEQIPRWPSLEKSFLVKCFTALEKRVVSHLCMTAHDRYRQFYKDHQSLFNHVPLNYIASLLGMSPETLSRIRKLETNS